MDELKKKSGRAFAAALAWVRAHKWIVGAIIVAIAFGAIVQAA